MNFTGSKQEEVGSLPNDHHSYPTVFKGKLSACGRSSPLLRKWAKYGNLRKSSDVNVVARESILSFERQSAVMLRRMCALSSVRAHNMTYIQTRWYIYNVDTNDGRITHSTLLPELSTFEHLSFSLFPLFTLSLLYRIWHRTSSLWENNLHSSSCGFFFHCNSSFLWLSDLMYNSILLSLLSCCS